MMRIHLKFVNDLQDVEIDLLTICSVESDGWIVFYLAKNWTQFYFIQKSDTAVEFDGNVCCVVSLFCCDFEFLMVIVFNDKEYCNKCSYSNAYEQVCHQDQNDGDDKR